MKREKRGPRTSDIRRIINDAEVDSYGRHENKLNLIEMRRNRLVINKSAGWKLKKYINIYINYKNKYFPLEMGEVEDK